MAEQGTRIIEVMHESGDRATAKPHRPNATLFEICEGPYQGMRGADADLFDLCGPIYWDREWVSIYETGEHMRWEEFKSR